VYKIIALDAGPSGIICDDPGKPAVKRISDWLIQMIADGRTRIILPEIADYEVRRKLLSLPHGAASVRRLDALVKPGGLLVYVPITTAAMRTAARLWGEAKRGGFPTADSKAIDGDVILAAQAMEYVGEGDRLWVATGNVKDLARYVGERAQPWEAIIP
jgi:predicted nucleic acid-binding protein